MGMSSTTGPFEFPMEDYRKQAEKEYADAFKAGIPGDVWTKATTEEKKRKKGNDS